MQSKEEIAYLIGALMGDGYFTKGYHFPRVGFSSSDLEFIELIKEIILKNFNFNINITKSLLSKKNNNWRDHYKIASRKLYPSLSYFTKNLKEIPLFIKESDNKIKANFLSGFFDAEGGICISTIKSRNALDRRIYLHQKNLELMNEIQSYLKLFNIKSFIQNGKGAYTLNIWGHESFKNFNEFIRFKIKRKQEKLEKALFSYKQKNIKWDSKLYKESILLKDKNDYSAREIRKNFIKKGINIPQTTIEKWINGGYKK